MGLTLRIANNSFLRLQEGDKIEAGEVICEIQTDKAVVAMEADDDAILAKILVNENEGGVKVKYVVSD